MSGSSRPISFIGSSVSKPLFNLSSRLWGSLTSIRLTLLLLLVLVLMAVLGTLVPQGEPLPNYLARFGPRWGLFIWRVGLTRLYESPWLLLPMGVLALNLSACVLRGLPRAIQRVSRPFSWEAARNLPERGRFYLAARQDPEALVSRVLRQELGRPEQITLEGRQVAFLLERGRFRPLGPYLIHLSLLLILIGGLVGKLWGLEGRLWLAEGETARAFLLPDNREQPLDFAVRLDKFQVNYYEQGIPAEFRADLTILRNGTEVSKAVCRVNEPVTVGGLTFYQSSYGTQPDGPVKFRVCQGQDCHAMEVPVRQSVTLPDGQAQIMVVRVDGNLQGLGPAVQVAVKSGPEHPRIFWVSQNHPELADRGGSPFFQPGPHRFQAEAIPFKFYSVFQVRRDPGVWWVYSGFLLFLPGFFLAFLVPAQRWAVVLQPTTEGFWEGRLLGASPRAREAFAAKTARLLTRLNEGDNGLTLRKPA